MAGIFVAPQYHGQGIGSALMGGARDFRALWEADVFEANHIGGAFYVAYGFGVV